MVLSLWFVVVLLAASTTAFAEPRADEIQAPAYPDAIQGP